MKPLLRAALALSLAVGVPAAAAAAPVKLSSPPITVDAGSTFSPLTDLGIKAAFPGNRPDAVYVSPDNRVTVSFEWRDSALRPAQVPALLAQFPAVIKSQVPGIKSLRSGSVNIGGTQWAQFVFVAPGKDGDVRRELLVTSLQNRTLVVTVSSSLVDYTKNAPAVTGFENSFRLN